MKYNFDKNSIFSRRMYLTEVRELVSWRKMMAKTSKVFVYLIAKPFTGYLISSKTVFFWCSLYNITQHRKNKIFPFLQICSFRQRIVPKIKSSIIGSAYTPRTEVFAGVRRTRSLPGIWTRRKWNRTIGPTNSCYVNISILKFSFPDLDCLEIGWVESALCCVL